MHQKKRSRPTKKKKKKLRRKKKKKNIHLFFSFEFTTINPVMNRYLLYHNQIPCVMFRLIMNRIATPKINQPEVPIHTMATSCVTISVSGEREITQWSWLNKNITFGYRSVNPACIVESENEGSSFVPVERKKKEKKKTINRTLF